MKVLKALQEDANLEVGQRSKASDILDLDLLLDAVHEAVSEVRIYVYEPPRHLKRALQLHDTGSREYFQLETELLSSVIKLARKSMLQGTVDKD